MHVIVPVYLGFEETRRCLASVLASAGETAQRVVVVDDASPDPRIGEHVRALAAEGKLTLIVNEHNRGFVASVNTALEACPDGDVVLLNSDTEVAPGWLDRLGACAARESRVGTVTPFSNN